MKRERLAGFATALVTALAVMGSGASAQELLVPGASNKIYFNGFQNIYDGGGVFKPLGVPLEVGDHIVSIVNVQNIDANGLTIFFSGNQNQLTGIAVQRVLSIAFPDPFNPARPDPHVTVGAPTISQFCTDATKTDCFNSGLMGAEMLALYRDVGGTNFSYAGPLGADVARATDGQLWLSAGVAAGPSGDPGFAYAHTDGQFPPPDEAFAGMNVIVNNTGFAFFGINDLNETEIGGSVVFNDVVLSNEIEFNPNFTGTIGGSPWLYAINDPATVRPFEMVAGACRFTGGGVDTLAVSVGDLLVGVPYFNGVLEQGSQITSAKGSNSVNRYQFGGQAGANTGQQPQPKGEWTHHQQSGPAGSFVFHGGTASAPQGTEIDVIRCSDPGVCLPARRAPVKQLDFDGIGTFRNIGSGKNKPKWLIANPNVTAEGNGNQTFDGTYHWFEVNIDDLGEPGNENSGANVNPEEHPEICPPEGFGEKSGTALADCRCPDYYRITVYNGVSAANVVKNPDGSIDLNSLDRTTVIYEARGYINGGNLQIHPPTGFDLK